MLFDKISPVLDMYMQSIQEGGKAFENIWNMFQSEQVHLNGHTFEAKFNEEHYGLFKNGVLFLIGNVDNGDFHTTFEQDKNDFGMVMEVLYDVPSTKVLEEMLSTEQKALAFLKQFAYVLSFATININGQPYPIANLLQGALH